MANKKKIHTNTQRQSERARNADGNRNSGGAVAVAVAVVDGGNVNDKKNRVHENYWILIQPKIAATK